MSALIQSLIREFQEISQWKSQYFVRVLWSEKLQPFYAFHIDHNSQSETSIFQIYIELRLLKITSDCDDHQEKSLVSLLRAY